MIPLLFMLLSLGGIAPASFGGTALATRLYLAQFPASVSGNSLLIWLGCLGGLLVIYNQLRTALGHGKATRVEQPIRVENVVGTFSRAELEQRFTEMGRRFEQVDERFEALETQLSEQVKKTDQYLHEMRHEFRGELQGITSNGDERRAEIVRMINESDRKDEERIVKVHDRVNVLSERLGGVLGELKHVAESARDAARAAHEAARTSAALHAAKHTA